MAGRMRAAAVAVVTAGLIVAGASPAFAPYIRQAANAVNVTEACPRYLSLEVARQAPMDPQPQDVTILAFEVAPSSQTLVRLVLNDTVRVRPVDPFLRPLPDEEEDFHLHGRAVLRWDTGRLAPGTRLLVGPIDVFGPEAQAPPIEVTISPRCDTPDLELSFVDSTDQLLTWRVSNPNPEAVDFNAQVVGTSPAQVVLGTVPANGEVTFQTTQVPGRNVVRLFVGGKRVDQERARLS
jgi:hypothetical protein